MPKSKVKIKFDPLVEEQIKPVKDIITEVKKLDTQSREENDLEKIIAIHEKIIQQLASATNILNELKTNTKLPQTSQAKLLKEIKNLKNTVNYLEYSNAWDYGANALIDKYNTLVHE